MAESLLSLYEDFLAEETIVDLDQELDIVFSMLRVFTSHRDFAMSWEKMGKEERFDLISDLAITVAEKV